MKFVILATLLLVFTLGWHQDPKPQAVIAKTPIELQHTTTHRIGVYDQFNGDPKKNFGEVGHCSGTAIGEHAILTAQHCLQDSNLIRLDDDKEPTVIVAILTDGNDHVIYIVKHDFTTWSEIDQRPLVVNEPVHFWGAPGKNKDVYRSGYFAELAPEPEIDKTFLLQRFVLPTYGGDSGSGIFDENGKIVAVITFGDKSADELSEPLQFSDAQIDVATAR